MNELETILLQTLSFFDPLSKEQILLQMDKKAIEAHPNLKMSDLDDLLAQLCRRGLLKRKKRKKELVWIRSYPRKSLKVRFIRKILELWERVKW